MGGTAGEQHSGRQQKTNKKRVRIQQTLDSFVKRQRRIIHNHQPDSFLVCLPDDILKDKLLVFFNVDELTKLGISCRMMASIINDYRGPLPHIVRQEKFPKQIHYSREFDGMQRFITVSQSQSFRFLMKTKRHRIAQVNIKLWNELWNESFDGPNNYVWWHSDNQKKLSVDAIIYEQIKYRNEPAVRKCLFNLEATDDEDSEGFYYMRTLDDTLFDMEENEEDDVFKDWDIDWWETIDQKHIEKMPLSKHIGDDLHDCVHYYWTCAKQAIAMDPEFCPSIHSFMTIDPMSEQPLCQYWPERCNLGACKKVDRIIPRWGQIQPTSLKKWESYTNTVVFGIPRTTYIQDIPWFRTWYRKPLYINRKNLFASLPSPIFIKGLLPHLSHADLMSLSMACPALSAFLIEQLRQK